MSKKQFIINKNKYDTNYYDASSASAKEKAMKQIFKYNEEMTCYYTLSDDGFKEESNRLNNQITQNEDLIECYKKHKNNYEADRLTKVNQEYKSRIAEISKQKSLYDAALKGDVKALERLLLYRSDYEYEGFEIKNLE